MNSYDDNEISPFMAFGGDGETNDQSNKQAQSNKQDQYVSIWIQIIAMLVILWIFFGDYVIRGVQRAFGLGLYSATYNVGTPPQSQT
jgi:hypothetical protein